MRFSWSVYEKQNNRLIPADQILPVVGNDALIPPQLLSTEHPATQASLQVVLRGRKEAVRILRQQDDRLLVICGPCSINDPMVALEYCRRLTALAAKLQSDLLIIMRAYLEKPRTTVGWKGLINDPDIDETYQINKGLRVSRQLFCDLTALGMPIASEMLDTITPQVSIQSADASQRCIPYCTNGVQVSRRPDLTRCNWRTNNRVAVAPGASKRIVFSYRLQEWNRRRPRSSC